MKNTFLLLSIILLSACGESSEPVRDKAYYLSHAQEREQKLSWCKESLENKDTDNCKAALSATAKSKTNALLGDGLTRN